MGTSLAELSSNLSQKRIQIILSCRKLCPRKKKQRDHRIAADGRALCCSSRASTPPRPRSELAAQCTWAPCRASRLLQQAWAHLGSGPGGRTALRPFPESVPAGRHPDPGRVFRGEYCFGTRRNVVNKAKGSLPRLQRTPVATRSL